MAPANDPDAVERALKDDPQIGCVIIEPTGGHWGTVPIRGSFLHDLLEITLRYNRLLIFDEVITGIPSKRRAVRKSIMAFAPT